MGANLPSPSGPGNGRAAEPATKKRRWLAGHSDPVARFAAPQLGCAPKTAEHRIRELPQECATIIRAFQALGDTVRLERFARPILTAYDQREAPPLVAATWNLAEEADAAEQIAETAYQHDPSDANLDRLIRASEAEIQRGEARLLALYVERDRRRRLA